MIFEVFAAFYAGQKITEAIETLNEGTSLLKKAAKARGGEVDELTVTPIAPKSDWIHAVSLLARAIKHGELTTSGEGESLVLRYYVWDDNPRHSGYRSYKNKHDEVYCEFRGDYVQFAGNTQKLLKEAQEVAAKIP